MDRQFERIKEQAVDRIDDLCNEIDRLEDIVSSQESELDLLRDRVDELEIELKDLNNN